MTWLEQNIDAYRIVSEILGDLRRSVRGVLEATYGDSWYRDGLPEEVFNRLVAAKEREKAIDWYEGQYQQIMDYAVFADLVEILDQNAELFADLTALAPNNALLQARFIELDVMRAKLGRARPISETELSFLGTFHLRFRKAISEMPVLEPPPSDESEAEEPAVEVPTPKRRASDRPPLQKPVEPPPAPKRRADDKPKPQKPIEPPSDPPQEAKAPEPPPEPREPVADDPEPPVPRKVQQVIERTVSPAAPDGDDDGKATGEDGPKKPPRRAVQSSSKPKAVANEEEPSDPSEAQDGMSLDDDEDADEDAQNTREPVGPKRLAEALENSEHRRILRELYREVTTIAEGVWSSEVTPAPLVWEQVTATDWYKNNFSRLGLQPLSVFYEVTGNVEQMAREGATKKQLQEFLKETNFAKTLLALRDMFQANNL